jgi:hypothetical protein
MGVQQTVGGVSRVLFPWWDGWAFDHLGVAAPFVVSGVLTLGSIGLIRGISAPPARGGVGARDVPASHGATAGAPRAAVPFEKEPAGRG